MPLSNKIIYDAPTGATHWDDQVRGLHLRVSPAGKKTFYLSYRTKTGIQRRPKLADVGVMTLNEARRAARDMLAKVALGGDPGADLQAERKAPSVSDLADRWITDSIERVKPRTLRESTRLVETLIKGKPIGALKVGATKHADVDAWHKAMRDTPYQANRALAALSSMFSFADKKELIAPGTNPCRHVERFKEKKRKRYMKKDEAPRVAAILAEYEASRPSAVAFIYLLILSGARPDEISRTMPEWVERVGAGGVLRLPDSKTGSKSVFLPPQVMDIIDRLPKVEGKTLLGIKSPKSLWDIVRRKAGVPDLRPYDLRHTFASAALEAGYSLDQIGELLGHASAQTTKRYAHLVDEKAHEAAATTAGLLERMMNPTTEAQT